MPNVNFVTAKICMDTLKLTLVQAELHWEDCEKNLSAFSARLSGVPPRSILLLPEMFNTGFSMNVETLAEPMDGPTVQWMRNLAAEKQSIIGGSLIIREAQRYFNRFIWMQPDGVCSWYDKRHLFGYAGEDEKFSPGLSRTIVSVSGWRLNLQVCYDLRFPVWARQKLNAGAPEYDVLVYVANWPERRIEAWKALLRARAIENQCYVAAVNRVGEDGNGIYYSGDSMVIDPLGEIVEQRTGSEDIFTVALNRAHLEELRQKFQFLRDSDSFDILV